MNELRVAVVASDEDQRSILQMQVDGTAVAATVQTHGTFPVGATDLVLRRILESHPDIVLVDIPKQAPSQAIRAIELIRSELHNSVLFAVGDTNQPQVIISAMRAGAREFLERPTSTTSLLEAFVRLTSSKRKAQGSGQRGKLFTFVNSKGGCGATTLAVNVALALQNISNSVALVDFAPLGHAALQLGAKPAFSILDAVRNLHRLDQALLESYMTPCHGGLQLLAGMAEPLPDEIVSTDLPRLFDLLVTTHKFVVVDASTRMDRAMRVVADLSDTVLLVATTDVASLWSAAKVQSYLAEGLSEPRLKLVINRFRKIPGFSDADIEAITHSKVVGKVPNNYVAVAGSIDRGSPVVQQNHSELARTFVYLASQLGQEEPEPKRKHFYLFGTE